MTQQRKTKLFLIFIRVMICNNVTSCTTIPLCYYEDQNVNTEMLQKVKTVKVVNQGMHSNCSISPRCQAYLWGQTCSKRA